MTTPSFYWNPQDIESSVICLDSSCNWRDINYRRTFSAARKVAQQHFEHTGHAVKVIEEKTQIVVKQ